jgi:hypothetical protein
MHLRALPDGRANAPETSNTPLPHTQFGILLVSRSIVILVCYFHKRKTVELTLGVFL